MYSVWGPYQHREGGPSRGPSSIHLASNLAAAKPSKADGHLDCFLKSGGISPPIRRLSHLPSQLLMPKDYWDQEFGSSPNSHFFFSPGSSRVALGSVCLALCPAPRYSGQDLGQVCCLCFGDALECAVSRTSVRCQMHACVCVLCVSHTGCESATYGLSEALYSLLLPHTPWVSGDSLLRAHQAMEGAPQGLS